MKYEEDYDDIDFPPCRVTSNSNLSSEKNLIKEKFNTNEQQPHPLSHKKLFLIIGIAIAIVLIVLIIALVVIFSKKNKTKSGGYIIVSYQVKPNEEIKIFNPKELKKEEDYTIEVYPNDDNSLRILGNSENIIDNFYKAKEEGIVQLKITFNKTLTTMSEMFQDCEHLTNVDLSRFESEDITSMSSAFLNCVNLDEIKFTNFNSKNVENMDNTFENCKELTGLNLSSYDITKLTSMESTFKDCINLVVLDVSNFNLNKKDIINKNTFENTNLRILNGNDNIIKTIQKYINIDNNKTCIIGDNEKCKSCKTEENKKYECYTCK